jgi:hypothetical protein
MTTQNPTDTEIATYQDRLAREGDHAGVELCEIALQCGEHTTASALDASRARDRLWQMMQDDAEPSQPHDASTIWVTCFGNDTVEEVLREAKRQSVTPQDYARDAVRQAVEQGADLGGIDAYKSLCKSLGIDCC